MTCIDYRNVHTHTDALLIEYILTSILTEFLNQGAKKRPYLTVGRKFSRFEARPPRESKKTRLSAAKQL